MKNEFAAEVARNNRSGIPSDQLLGGGVNVARRKISYWGYIWTIQKKNWCGFWNVYRFEQRMDGRYKICASIPPEILPKEHPHYAEIIPHAHKGEFKAYISTIPDGNKKPSYDDFLRATVGWDDVDSRRCQLIRKRTPEEEFEFKVLQCIFDLRRDYFRYQRVGVANSSLIDEKALTRLRAEDNL